MSDVKKTITVDLVADAKKFQADFKKATQEVRDLGKNQQTLKKAGIKEDKNLQKITKDFLKFNKGEQQQAIKHEKQLATVLKQKGNILRDLHKAGKANSEEYKKEHKALKETANLYTSIKKARVQAFGQEKSTSTSKSGGGAALAIGGIAAAVSGVVIGAIKGRITDALDAVNEYNSAAVESLGDKNFRGNSKSLANKAGNAAGFTNTEVMKQAAAIVRQTGSAGDAGTSLQFSRAAMIDQGQSAGFMGMQARGGILNQAAKKEQEKIIAAGFVSGLQRGRMGEFLTGVSSLAERAQGRSAGNVNSGGYADLLAAFGKSRLSGLQGARGAQVLQQLEQGVMAPGAGEAGQSLILRSKGFGTPGGNTDYYSALKRQQSGFAGERGADELKSFVDQLQVEFGKNSQAASLAGSNVTGVSLDIMEKVMKLVNGFSGDSKELKKQIGELTKGSLPLEEQVRDILDDKIAESLKTQVDISNTLVRQGAELQPIALELKNLVNTVVTDLTDVAIPILKDIRNIVKDTYDFFRGETVDSKTKAVADTDMKILQNRYGSDPKKLVEEINKLMKDNELKMADLRGTFDVAHLWGGGNIPKINALSQAQGRLRELKDGALASFDKKPVSNQSNMRNLSAKEIEEAVKKGVERANKEPSPTNVTVHNRPTIITQDHTQVQYR